MVNNWIRLLHIQWIHWKSGLVVQPTMTSVCDKLIFLTRGTRQLIRSFFLWRLIPVNLDHVRGRKLCTEIRNLGSWCGIDLVLLPTVPGLTFLKLRRQLHDVSCLHVNCWIKRLSVDQTAATQCSTTFLWPRTGSIGYFHRAACAKLAS